MVMKNLGARQEYFSFFKLKTICITLTSLVSFDLLGFYLVPSSGTCSSASSFCLSCYLYFYVCGGLVMCLDLGEVASVGGALYVPTVHSPLVTQTIRARGSP